VAGGSPPALCQYCGGGRKPLVGGGQEHALDEPALLPASGLTELLAAAQAGDTVLVPEGLYQGDFTVPTGVTLQPQDGARVAIDVVTEFDMRGATVRDIEIFASAADRTHQGTSINMSAANSKLIGCYVHDMRASSIYWFGSGAGEIRDCVIYCGISHAIYSHNHSGGRRVIANNVFINASGQGYALHIYSGGGNYIKDYTAQDNVTAHNNNIVGGGLGISGLIYESNVHYKNTTRLGRTGETHGDCVATDNALVAGSVLAIAGFETAEVSGTTDIATPYVVITPCAGSQRKLAHVTAYNPAMQPTMEIDLAALSLPHGDYMLRNTQNPAQGYRFSYGGDLITCPLTDWTAAPMVGAVEPLGNCTLPMFGTFILEPT
jgi:hypothetical protein